MTSTSFSSIINKEGINHKRLENMVAPLFTDGQLKVVQEGVHHMFHVVRDIVNSRESGTRFPQNELLNTINKLEAERWERIRTDILESKSHDYNEGNFTEQENRMPVKIMYDMMLIMSNLKAYIAEVLKESCNTEKQLRNEMKSLHATLSETQSELTDVRWNYKKDKATLNTIQSTIHHLEKVNSEKTEKIEELQRQDNVNLWQKEKERVIAKSKGREAELAAEVERLKQEKISLQKKFENVDSQLKMQKLKNEVIKKVPGEPADVCTTDLTKSKQHIYVLEKDLRSIENELFNQQKYMIGLLKGIKEDYWTTWDDVLTNEGVPVTTARQGRQLGLRLNNIFDSAARGKLGAIRADLPDHYLATDNEVNRVPVKKLSSAYGVKLAPKQKIIQENGNTQTNGNEVTSTGRTKRRSTMLPEEHPELVNPRTGLVNMIAVMKYFPYMVKEYVAEQWGHFKAYDTNGDGDLDLTEMMNAMKNTIGGEFTAAQVRDTMMEVDIDHSQTIDFFEYLSIAHLLMEKKGRSEVFRSKIARDQGRHVSKTCVVQ